MAKVVGHRILIKPDVVPEKTKGGLYLPQDTRERDQMAETRGTVVGVGEAAYTTLGWKEGAQTGDRVSFPKYAGQVTKLRGIEHRIINDEDVLLILDPEDELENEGA